MTVSDTLILYSRADCHLCDLAAAMMDRAGVPWRLVDIDDDPELAGKYGIYVPVLQHPGSGRELFFPFDDETLLQFLGGDP
jgi:glutaredoxin